MHDMHDMDAHARGSVEAGSPPRRPAPSAENDDYEVTGYRLPADLHPAGDHSDELTSEEVQDLYAWLTEPRKITFTYLGSPYSKWADKDAAAAIVSKAAAHLMRNGEVVYSPIAHGHAVAEHGLPLDWDFWKKQCQPFIDAADRLVVLQMEGWGESVGLHYEIGEFRRAGKPVEFMGLDELVIAGVLAERRAA